MIAPVAERFKVTRGAIYNRIKKSQALQDAQKDAEEKTLDLAESKLIANIREKKEASIFFYLKTKGKHRGYFEKTIAELTGKGGKDLFEGVSNDELEERIAELEKKLKP